MRNGGWGPEDRRLYLLRIMMHRRRQKAEQSKEQASLVSCTGRQSLIMGRQVSQMRPRMADGDSPYPPTEYSEYQVLYCLSALVPYCLARPGTRRGLSLSSGALFPSTFFLCLVAQIVIVDCTMYIRVHTVQ